MRRDESAQQRAPVAVSAVIIAAVVALVAGAVGLMIVSGPAILLDLAVGAAAFLCL